MRVTERGPFKASEDGKHVYSDDFTHDVRIDIDGDWESEEQRKAYAKWVAVVLTIASAIHPASPETVGDKRGA